jgi:hypothetical protein
MARAHCSGHRLNAGAEYVNATLSQRTDVERLLIPSRGLFVRRVRTVQRYARMTSFPA